jgi:hypothetical protein
VRAAEGAGSARGSGREIGAFGAEAGLALIAGKGVQRIWHSGGRRHGHPWNRGGSASVQPAFLL